MPILPFKKSAPDSGDYSQAGTAISNQPGKGNQSLKIEVYSGSQRKSIKVIPLYAANINEIIRRLKV